LYKNTTDRYLVNTTKCWHWHTRTYIGCHVNPLCSKIFKHMDRKAYKLRPWVLVLSNWYLTAVLETRSLVCLWKSWRVMDILYFKFQSFFIFPYQKVTLLCYFKGTPLLSGHVAHTHSNKCSKTMFPDQQINLFLMAFEVILRYNEIGFWCPKTLVARKSRFSLILFLGMSHDMTAGMCGDQTTRKNRLLKNDLI